MRFEDCPDDPTKVRIKMNEYCIPKPWVGLTEDEKAALIAYTPHPLMDRTWLINMVEAKLKEKNSV